MKLMDGSSKVTDKCSVDLLVMSNSNRNMARGWF